MYLNSWVIWALILSTIAMRQFCMGLRHLSIATEKCESIVSRDALSIFKFRCAFDAEVIRVTVQCIILAAQVQFLYFFVLTYSAVCHELLFFSSLPSPASYCHYFHVLLSIGKRRLKWINFLVSLFWFYFFRTQFWIDDTRIHENEYLELDLYVYTFVSHRFQFECSHRKFGDLLSLLSVGYDFDTMRLLVSLQFDVRQLTSEMTKFIFEYCLTASCCYNWQLAVIYSHMRFLYYFYLLQAHIRKQNEKWRSLAIRRHRKHLIFIKIILVFAHRIKY